MQDHYKVLGIEAAATEQAIKEAYREAQRRWHPDLNPGDAAAADRFRSAATAYEVLGDPAKKRLYDLGLTDTGFDPAKFVNAEISEDALLRGFVSMFGTWLDSEVPGMRSKVEEAARRQKERNAEAAARSAKSPKPRASKARAASPKSSCSSCGGTKRVRMSQGIFEISRPCRACACK